MVMNDKNDVGGDLQTDLNFENEALFPAALPKDLHPRLLQLSCEREGLECGVPWGAASPQTCSIHHLNHKHCLVIDTTTGATVTTST